ncbi:MAG: eukaryotic-like serine/threonine-protein kinase [Acidobacteriota bacterium]|jgi:serine/threonine-protein kinase|nr:eukaryotic-like serine/threonine-protein kinase [Acidobacteriota bacterium]
MTPERYHKIGELFHEALELEADERAAFLNRACAGDAELRREIESLIRSHEGGGGVIDEPALDVAAELFAGDSNGQVEGQTLAGRYRVLSLLGAGGMGRVYLAEDAELGRRVALKLLPEHLTHDAEQVRRFRQEARAASALNHPNIITVYGIEEVDGSSVIASEYIEGETLRERLSRGPLPPAEALDIAAQIASALRAAHEAGIVHRDVKPENVMLRPDGYVKVLDFGIAKLAPHRTNAAEENGQNGSTVKTTPGLIMGTDRYMSPEQARGQEVDARADVWSLGCVLYEMLAGVPPFTGETASDVVAAVLKTEPAPLPQVAKGTPGELQRIVLKCLEKGREERYPSAEELFTDLRRLQKRLEAGGAGGAAPSAGRRFAARVAILIALTLFAGSVGLGLYFYKARSTPPVGDKKSIAVLPLKPISAAHRDEIYEVGIADSLINRLSSTGGLVVRPLSATRKYADVEQDPLAAGREQQADYVLASNYQLAGGKIRITAQLLEVASGRVEENYKSEKDAGDVFSMQDAVAEEIGKLLLARFSAAASRPALKRGTTNEEAYRLYLQGMNFFDRRNGAKSLEAFEQAVGLDPDYAQAWAGVAHAHRTIASILPSTADVHEGYRKSTEAINRALELDPNLSEAYSARCDWKMYYEYDYGGAEAACKRAIELKPDSAVAHNVYARLLILSRFDEAIAEIRTAIELDPTSFYHQIVYTVMLTYARRYDEAARQLETLAAMNPPEAVGRFWLVGGLAMGGNHAEAFERLTRFQKLAGFDEETIRLFKTAYQTSGWQGVLREQAKRYDKNSSYIFHAYVYAPMGDSDRAFEYLEKAYQQREHFIVYLKVDPRFDSLRGDPRYDALVKRLRLQ